MHLQLSFRILLSEGIDTCDHERDGNADHDRDLAVGRRAVAGGSEAEVVAEGRARKQAEDRHGAVAAALTGQNELTQRAAAQQHAAEADQQHSKEVPQAVGMRNGLLGKAEGEVSGLRHAGQEQVAGQRADQDRRKAEDELRLAEQHQIAHAADHAKARPLGQRADDESGREADKDGRMERTGAGSGLGEVDEGGGQKQQCKHREGQDHEHAALRLGERIAALEGVALIEEENAR